MRLCPPPILCCIGILLYSGAIGGAISIDTKDFIGKLIEANLLDKFETRYIIFDVHKIDFKRYDELIYLANVFEVEWLKYVNAKYSLLANKDIQRIKMIEDRINKNENKVLPLTHSCWKIPQCLLAWHTAQS